MRSFRPDTRSAPEMFRVPPDTPGYAFAVLEDLEVPADGRTDQALKSLADSRDPTTVGLVVATRVADECGRVLHGVVYAEPLGNLRYAQSVAWRRLAQGRRL